VRQTAWSEQLHCDTRKFTEKGQRSCPSVSLVRCAAPMSALACYLDVSRISHEGVSAHRVKAVDGRTAAIWQLLPYTCRPVAAGVRALPHRTRSRRLGRVWPDAGRSSPRTVLDGRLFDGGVPRVWDVDYPAGKIVSVRSLAAPAAKTSTLRGSRGGEVAVIMGRPSWLAVGVGEGRGCRA
jgi:hypothetical protein